MDLEQFEGHTPGDWYWVLNDGPALLSSAKHRPAVLTGLDLTGLDRSEGYLRLEPLDPDTPDMRLIAAAPALLAELRAARAELAAMRDTMKYLKANLNVTEFPWPEDWKSFALFLRGKADEALRPKAGPEEEVAMASEIKPVDLDTFIKYCQLKGGQATTKPMEVFFIDAWKIAEELKTLRAEVAGLKENLVETTAALDMQRGVLRGEIEENNQLKARACTTDELVRAAGEASAAWERGWDPSRVEAHGLFVRKFDALCAALAAVCPTPKENKA